MPVAKSKQNLDLAETQQNLQSVYQDLEQDWHENLFALGRNFAIVLVIASVFAALLYFCRN